VLRRAAIRRCCALAVTHPVKLGFEAVQGGEDTQADAPRISEIKLRPFGSHRNAGAWIASSPRPLVWGFAVWQPADRWALSARRRGLWMPQREAPRREFGADPDADNGVRGAQAL